MGGSNGHVYMWTVWDLGIATPHPLTWTFLCRPSTSRRFQADLQTLERFLITCFFMLYI